jgi:polar amino acid transport system substrate-binding protein
MKKLAVLCPSIALLALAAACGQAKTTTSTSGAVSEGNACAKANLQTLNPGQLTIGTDNPAYFPYFAGGPGHSWTGKYNNDPYKDKGFEDAVAYAVAQKLGFSKAQVKWSVTHFNESFKPGPKSFDFYLAQVSYEPVRAKSVDFSSSYYDVTQGVVALKGKPIDNVTTIAGLKPYKFGVQEGTTSYNYIQDRIHPSHATQVYNSTNDAITALKDGQIDALVADFPTAFYIADVQLSPNGHLVGQLPVPAGGEHFGLVLAKGSSLTACVDKAIAGLRADGSLVQIQDKWLSQVAQAPVLK